LLALVGGDPEKLRVALHLGSKIAQRFDINWDDLRRSAVLKSGIDTWRCRLAVRVRRHCAPIPTAVCCTIIKAV
jgi:hypothetical protein